MLPTCYITTLLPLRVYFLSLSYPKRELKDLIVHSLKAQIQFLHQENNIRNIEGSLLKSSFWAEWGLEPHARTVLPFVTFYKHRSSLLPTAAFFTTTCLWLFPNLSAARAGSRFRSILEGPAAPAIPGMQGEVISLCAAAHWGKLCSETDRSVWVCGQILWSWTGNPHSIKPLWKKLCECPDIPRKRSEGQTFWLMGHKMF